jgi:hypothetical protein
MIAENWQEEDSDDGQTHFKNLGCAAERKPHSVLDHIEPPSASDDEGDGKDKAVLAVTGKNSSIDEGSSKKNPDKLAKLRRF